MATTKYIIAEQIFNILEGGTPGLASSISMNELKIAAENVINSLLKMDYLNVNEKLGEKIPNGAMLGWYEDIDVVSWNNRSKCTLPVKPVKLPRNMGIYSIVPKINIDGYYDFDKEFIPLQMGQSGMLKSQALISDLLGQVGYENFGGDVIFTKDIKKLYPDIKLAMRLVIMDMTLYSDYDILPITPEIHHQVVQEVIAMYSQQPIPDKLVDSTVKENQKVPVSQQKQS